jgi:hypothetical protein
MVVNLVANHLSKLFPAEIFPLCFVSNLSIIKQGQGKLQLGKFIYSSVMRTSGFLPLPELFQTVVGSS